MTRIFWYWCFLGSGEMSHRNQSSEFRRMFWGCLWQEIFGGNLFEEVASQEFFFCNDIYVGTNNHEKTSNYCRLLILRYLLQMEVYSPLYILHLHFLGQMKILHDLLVWLSLIPQHYNLTLFISSWATKSCPGFCHVRIFTYLSVAKRKQAKL